MARANLYQSLIGCARAVLVVQPPGFLQLHNAQAVIRSAVHSVARRLWRCVSNGVGVLVVHKVELKYKIEAKADGALMCAVAW